MNDDTTFCSGYRTRLEALALPNHPDVAEHKTFFCASRVRRFFSRSVVDGVLNCPCQKCSLLRPRLGLTRKDIRNVTRSIVETFDFDDTCNTDPTRKDGPSDGNAAYCLTLGLLLYIDYPALILTFAHQKCTDATFISLLDELSAEGIRDRFWPRARWAADVETLSVSRRLRWQRYKFFLPILKAHQFSDYNENVILPFLDEKKIGVENDEGEILSEGAYGQIYSFEIPSEYHDFTSDPLLQDVFPGPKSPQSVHLSSPMRFVRKELKDSHNSGIFQTERKNLDYIQLIKDPHIVRVLKAYKHGGVGNIIFPEARTNLYHYLRDARYGASDISYTSLEHHPFWVQIHGLARGVHKILNYEAEDLGKNDVLYGYHFDLKPANILIEHSGRFIISDFGQAHFKKVGASSSRVVGFGGTESYAPPEFDDLAMRQSRKYDIWSLGCIFLEIVTFIVLGQDGIYELDRRRTSVSTDASSTDDRFISRDSGTWQLKPAIATWMDYLITQTRPVGSERFLSDIINVIRGMLNVDIESRYNSRDLCCLLSEILTQRRSSTASMNVSVPTGRFPALVAASVGVEVGAEAMSRIVGLKFHHQQCWNSGQIRLLRTSTHLDLVVFQGKKERRVPIGDVRTLKLIPLYALKDTSQHRFRDSSLYLHGKVDGNSVRPACDQFYSEKRTDILYLQEALLGQKVLQHLDTAEVSLQQSRPTGGIFPRRLFGERPHDRRMGTNIREDSPSVQFWKDGFRARRGSEGDIDPHQGYDQRFRPSLSRIVVFTPTRIHLVQINDSVSLADDATTGLKLCIRPSTKAPNSTFDCLTLNKEPDLQHPGLSVSSQAMQFQEDTKAVQLSEMEITFHTQADTEAFRKRYRSLKYKWEEDRKACIKLQNEMGPRFGYAPNAF